MFFVFFFNDTATTEIYTLSLHDALPIYSIDTTGVNIPARIVDYSLDVARRSRAEREAATRKDRKSTRLNSSHANISYAVFCLKKKKNYIIPLTPISKTLSSS